ncbi:MAG: site-2 protease family protein [Thermoplasmata archaeon]|nr:site-2 protease family protein [Thermoplasmata archaeon]
MTAFEAYLIVLVAILAYIVAIAALRRAGRIGPDRSLTLFGPALMLKTQKGNALLDRIGRYRKLWSALGDLGLILAGVAMVGVLVVLGLDAIIARQIPASAAPQPAEALGIPGINPIIPLGYGLVALIVGIVLHELMHGVIARSQNIGVKSVGILWLVIPIGAFVEQDEASMLGARRRIRGRVAAAGILGNFALAVLFFALLAAITSTSLVPNADGVGIAYVVPGFPADNASLAVGDIVTSVNGTSVSNSRALLDTLSKTSANETVPLSYFSEAQGRTVSTTTRLAPLSSYTHVRTDAPKGFLGVSPTFLTPSELKGELVNPFASPYGALPGGTYWIVLPLAGLEPVQGTTAGFFHVSGPLAALGPSDFWILSNLLYWLAWMDLLLGISNALPLVPLDGGLLFRDFAASAAARLRKGWNAARLERFSSRAVAASSAAVILLLAWQFIAPHL